MKSILLLLAAFTTLSISVSAQGGRKSPHDTVSNANASVTYGRPYKKGRDIFGGLEKYGKVYRVGADEATIITFNKAVKFGDKDIPAGSYTLFAIPNENEWTIILNSQLGQWGAYDYDKNKDKDVAQIKVPVKKLDNVVEQLTLSFAKDNSLIIAWDKTQVTVPLKY
jgi:hypothetical protein